MIYAIATATDGDGNTWSSTPISTTVTFDQPVIASIGVSTDVSGDLPMLTLSANGIQDGVGNVTSVAFYRDTSGTGVYDSSTVTPVGTTDETDGAGIEIDPRTLSGPETFFAIATDDGSYTSVPVAAAVNPVVIGAASAGRSSPFAPAEAARPQSPFAPEKATQLSRERKATWRGDVEQERELRSFRRSERRLCGATHGRCMVGAARAGGVRQCAASWVTRPGHFGNPRRGGNKKLALPQNLWVVFAAAERGDWIFGGMAGQMNGGEEEKRPGG